MLLKCFNEEEIMTTEKEREYQKKYRAEHKRLRALGKSPQSIKIEKPTGVA